MFRRQVNKGMACWREKKEANGTRVQALAALL